MHGGGGGQQGDGRGGRGRGVGRGRVGAPMLGGVGGHGQDRGTSNGGHGGGGFVADKSDTTRPQSSHDSDSRKEDKEGFVIPFTLKRMQMVEVMDVGKRGKLEMMKPSDIFPSHEMEVFLHVESSASLFCLEIMQTVLHRNILHLEGLVEQVPQNAVAAFVLSYSGLLSELLLKRISLANRLHLVPSNELLDIVSQLVEGLDELRMKNYYHGNFRLSTTYYQINEDTGQIIVKLANFKQKGSITLTQAQIEDWNDLGTALQTISQNARRQNHDCILIDHLAQKLKAFSQPEQLGDFKQQVLNEVFFWNKQRRTEFAIYTIPKRLSDPDFRSKVLADYKCNTPWDTSNYCGLKKAVNQYLKDKWNTTYDGANKFHHLQYTSACYTHEDKIKGSMTHNLSVDEAFQLCDPGVFVNANDIA